MLTSVVFSSVYATLAYLDGESVVFCNFELICVDECSVFIGVCNFGLFGLGICSVLQF